GRDLPTALMAVSPLYFGTPAHSTYWFRGYNMMEMMVYAGLVPLFFAAYAGGRRRDVPRVGFWLVLALGALGVAYALPVFNLVNYAPVIGLANNGRLRLLFRFALAVAAAHVYPETPVVRLLHGDPSLFRVTATLPDRFMPPDAKLPYRLFDVDLFEVLNLKRYTQLQRTVNGFASGPDNTIRTFRFDPARHGPLLNLMN